MADTLEPLIADLLDWIGPGRPYADVMEACRTSCARLPVWEEANLRGFVDQRIDASGERRVFLSELGATQLQRARQVT